MPSPGSLHSAHRSRRPRRAHRHRSRGGRGNVRARSVRPEKMRLPCGRNPRPIRRQTLRLQRRSPSPPAIEPLPERLALAEETEPCRRRAGRGRSAGGRDGHHVRRQQQLPAAGRRRRAAGARGGVCRATGRYRWRCRRPSATTGVKGARPEEAARYNRWLAERRVERVRATGCTSMPGGSSRSSPGFLEHEPSRRVTARACGRGREPGSRARTLDGPTDPAAARGRRCRRSGRVDVE